MKIRNALSIGALALCYVGAAHANLVTGGYWHVPEAIARDATLANVPATSPDVVFVVNSPLNFSSGGAYTVAEFLNSSGASAITENTPGTLASALDENGIGTFMAFAGWVSVTNGQTFTVTHDDGLTLAIGGLTVINAPGPTAPTVTTATYTGPTGIFAFNLAYGECCGAPAVLQIDLPLSDTPVPEPGTLALLGLGLAGLGLSRRRKAH